MRYVLVVTAIFSLMLSFAQAQDETQQRINQAIDLAERICLVGNRYKFSVDASGNVTILKLTPGGEGKITVDNADAKGSQFFDDENIRRQVDSDIRDCMKAQWPEVLNVINVQSRKNFRLPLPPGGPPVAAPTPVPNQ